MFESLMDDVWHCDNKCVDSIRVHFFNIQRSNKGKIMHGNCALFAVTKRLFMTRYYPYLLVVILESSAKENKRFGRYFDDAKDPGSNRVAMVVFKNSVFGN